MLVKNAGEIVSNEEILNEVWRDTFVNESNINTQVNAICNALGQTEDRIFIETEDKGFRFVVTVKRLIKTSLNLVKDVIENEPKNSDYPDNTKEVPELKVVIDTLEGTPPAFNNHQSKYSFGID